MDLTTAINSLSLIDSKVDKELLKSLHTQLLQCSSGSSRQSIAKQISELITTSTPLTTQVLEMVMTLLKDTTDDLAIRRYGTQAMSNLSYNVTNQDLIRDSNDTTGVIPQLVHILTEDCSREDEEICLNITGTFFNLIHKLRPTATVPSRFTFSMIDSYWQPSDINVLNQDMLRTTGAIVPLIHLLTHKVIDVRMYSATSIAALSYFHTLNQDAVGEAGALPLLIQLLKEEDSSSVTVVGIHSQVTNALSRLAGSSMNQELIRELDGIPLLVSCLINEEMIHKPQVIGNAIRALVNLARNDENKEIIHEVQGIHAFIALLRKEVPNHPSSAGLGLLDHKLRDHENILKGLYNLTINNRMNQDLFRTIDGIQPLIKLTALQLTDELDGAKPSTVTDIRKFAILVLNNLAFNHTDNQEVIRELGGIEQLMTLLTDSNEDICENSLLTLATLATNNVQNQELIVNLDGIQQLIQLLSNPQKKKEVRAYAAQVLTILASSDESIYETIRESGGIEGLVSLLSDTITMKDTLGCRMTLKALETLCVSSDFATGSLNCDKVYECGGVSLIVPLLHDDVMDIRSNAALLLYHLASNTLHSDLIREEGGIDGLIPLLFDEEHDSLRLFALHAFSRLAANLTNRDRIRELGGIPRLIQMLSLTEDSTNGALKECRVALSTLDLLAMDNVTNQDLIRSEGGIEAFVTLLTHSDTEIRCNAVTALSFVCHKQHVLNQDTIRQAGAIPKLIELLNDKTGDDICKNVCCALRNLADHNVANQDAIREANGILPLIRLLVEDDSSINPIEQILETLASLALGNKPNQDMISKCGGLQHLILRFQDENEFQNSNSQVQCNLLYALGNLSDRHMIHQNLIHNANDCIPRLIELMQKKNKNDDNGFDADDADDAANEEFDEEFLMLMQLMNNMDNDDVRKAAAYALIKCCNQYSPNVELLRNDKETVVMMLNALLSGEDKAMTTSYLALLTQLVSLEPFVEDAIHNACRSNSSSSYRTTSTGTESSTNKDGLLFQPSSTTRNASDVLRLASPEIAKSQDMLASNEFAGVIPYLIQRLKTEEDQEGDKEEGEGNDDDLDFGEDNDKDDKM